MMTVARHNNGPSYFQKNLSEWWNEESEYFLQRIEKWAGFTRGYNRLKSRKSFDDDDGDIGENLNWKNINTFKKSQRKKIEEKSKINCCGRFNYQSNCNFDNTCLETYRYDHSIYFKTIGDIKSSKNINKIHENDKNFNNEISNCFNDEEKIEWDIRMNSDYSTSDKSCWANNKKNTTISNNNINCDCYNQNYINSDNNSDFEKYLRTVWPNINEFIEDETNEDYIDDIKNNNYVTNNNYYNDNSYNGSYSRRINNKTTDSSNSNITQGKNQDKSLSRFFKLRKINKSPKSGRNSIVYGDNNVSWPSVLLNYTKNMDPALSTAHRRAFNIPLNHY